MTHPDQLAMRDIGSGDPVAASGDFQRPPMERFPWPPSENPALGG
jgi:hypothetical protein